MPDLSDLKNAMRDLGLNVSEMARAVGIGRVTLSRWVHGRQRPDARTWREVATRLKRLQKRHQNRRESGQKGG